MNHVKPFIRYFFFFVLAGLLVFASSCEKEELPEAATGHLEISVAVEETLKSALNDSNDISTFHILLSVVNSLGETVLNKELIPLYRFGNQFITERIEMKAGRYQLSRFMVLDPDGTVVYASPLEGAPKAYLVKDPLPLGFSILPDQETRLVPEVLVVGNQDPSEFGYASFSFQVVRPLRFYAMAVIEDSMLMAPIVITDAVLTVHSPDGWSHWFYLEPRVNRIVIRGGVHYYKLMIEKEGFEPVIREVPADLLRSTTPEEPVIFRLSRPLYHILTLQPGPEKGKDAMIMDIQPDHNFGDYPYFEATFLSDSILTVMRTMRSLLEFNPVGLPKDARIEKAILTLHFENLIPWDSIFYDSLINYIDPNYGFAWYGAVLQQIVQPWNEHEVTWDKQPQTIEANQVYISPTVISASFINMDVTSLFVPVQEIAAANHGMMLKLYPSEQFPGFRFASSDYPVPGMRPKLMIFYSLNAE